MERLAAVFFKKGTASALDNPSMAGAPGIGTAGVFDPNLDGQKRPFSAQGREIVDDQTGSAWSIFGKAESGPLLSEQLTPTMHGNHLWFSWVVFKPNTTIFVGNQPRRPKLLPLSCYPARACSLARNTWNLTIILSKRVTHSSPSRRSDR